jgi:hypothetical protein
MSCLLSYCMFSYILNNDTDVLNVHVFRKYVTDRNYSSALFWNMLLKLT